MLADETSIQVLKNVERGDILLPTGGVPFQTLLDVTRGTVFINCAMF